MRTLRQLRRRFGIAAPRVAIRTQVPWYWRWVTLLSVVGVLLGVVWVSYDLGRRYAGFDRSEAADGRARLQDLNRRLQEENAALRREVAAAERRLHMDLSAQENLSAQIRGLSEENALLKEDLAFFQTLMASGGDPGGISVSRFRVQPDALPGEYRYRLLVVQSKQRVREFRGTLQFIVDLDEGGTSSVVTIPGESDHPPAYNLTFKFYQRVEGTFLLPPDAVVRRVQVRVLENGNPTPLSTQSVTLS
jgi:hypothetical protein